MIRMLALAAALCLAAPALAQSVYYNGEPVEFLNADTGQWEAATITAISGSGASAQYNVQGNVMSVGHTVNSNDIRMPAGFKATASDVAAAAVYDKPDPTGEGDLPSIAQPDAAASTNIPSPPATQRAP